ncbi:hypothetical protein DB30_04688 [Enhygromyxa salina]|uniref:Uncharacterized protein n=1 Tax=Enhygromyxa salina TaxID=215803 RepID=A0A0C2A747_9BACT|nr:hypothetical protein DB30_04688 [Enhygromyxa salina]
MLGCLLSMLVFACKPDPIDSDTAMDEGTPPDAGVAGDPLNCGEDNLNCVGPLQIGTCIDGECQGRLTECYELGASCAAICAEIDASCEASCEGVVAFGWAAPSKDEALTNCGLVIEDTQTPLAITCDAELPFSAYPAISCCCKLP